MGTARNITHLDLVKFKPVAFIFMQYLSKVYSYTIMPGLLLVALGRQGGRQVTAPASQQESTGLVELRTQADKLSSSQHRFLLGALIPSNMSGLSTLAGQPVSAAQDKCKTSNKWNIHS